MSYLEHPIFLCGAPRSGTTLMHSLLDNVSGFVSIPVENHIGDKFYEYRSIHESNLEEYFLRDYIFNFDVQISTNKEYQAYLNPRAKQRFGEHTETSSIKDLNEQRVEKFIETYQDHLSNNQNFNLGNPIRALAHAYAETMYELDPGKQTNFVHRRNLVTETQALELKKVFPKAKFIHLIRDPRTRYLSAKQRAIRKRKILGKYVPSVEEYDFCSHRAIVSMYSFMLAERNKRLIGDDYIIVKQEDLANNRESAVQDICNKLKLDFQAGMLTPTQYGIETTGNSSFKQTQEEIQIKMNSRLNSYNSQVSKVEKYVINYYCSRVANQFGYEMDVIRPGGFRKTLGLMKYERLSDYFKNRKKSLRMIVGNYIPQHNRQFERLYKEISLGKHIAM